jgi:thiamine biosynthesis lipoprotein
MKLFEYEAIGTHWWITIEDDIDPTKLESLCAEIKHISETFEKDYSRFIRESYIGRLNTEKQLENFPIELYEMLTFSNQITTITDGHFSATVGGTLASLGYDEKYSFSKQNTILPSYILELSESKIRISNDAKIDLGGIGKGWLIDKISDFLKSKHILYFSVNGGGDIFATSHKDGKPWEYFLENPYNKEEVIGTIHVDNASIACSAPSRRQWKDAVSGEKLHHLVDQKSKQAIDTIKMVFTHGKSALMTDSASTALFVSSPEYWGRIKTFCNVSYRIFAENDTIYSTEDYPGTFF